MDMNQDAIDKMFMHRCIQLAKHGQMLAKPNPMVGAVIVCHGRIIGEGYHVRFGEGHAEVNAFASVKSCDEQLLPESTMYVSLEPCSHFGKTPPCADLIIRKGVRHVVCGSVDPFAKVRGRGIQRMRDAGIDVKVGVLEDECLELNRPFMTFNTYKRPYILLKWAQTANGYIDDHGKALSLSTPFTKMLVHRLRSEYDAILVGRVTDEREHPQLNVREWSGPDPLRLVLRDGHSIEILLKELFEKNIQTLMVEGGTRTLQSFMDMGFWDEIRIETAQTTVEDGTLAPVLPKNIQFSKRTVVDGNVIDIFDKKAGV